MTDVRGLAAQSAPRGVRVARPRRAAAVPLLERGDELGELASRLDAAVGGQGSALAVEGPPGIGKTALLRALEESALDRGARVVAASGSEFEQGFPFATAQALLGPTLGRLEARERRRVVEGAARLGAAAIGLGSGRATAGSLFASIDGLYWVAANLAELGPLVLILDDVQWSDLESLRWISYLSRRVGGGPILVAIAARPAEPGTDWPQVEALIRDAIPTVIRPQPLSAAAIKRLIGDHLGEPDSEFVQACVEVTGGNPFLADQLLASLARDGVAPAASEAERLGRLGPPAVARAALERVSRLGHAATAATKALAILGDGSELGTVAALARLELEEAQAAADRLAAAGVVEAELPLRFIHPLVRSAIHDDVGAAERAVDHARAARLLADRGARPETVAGHLLACEPGAGDFAVLALHSAARLAAARGAPALAARYLRRALAEAPGRARRPAILRELGAAEVAAGDARSALDHLEEAIDTASDPEAHAAAQRTLAVALLNLGRPEDAVERLRSAIAEFADAAPELRLWFEADLASLEEMSMRSDHEASRRRLEALFGELKPGRPADGVLLATLAHMRMGSCEPAGEVAELAERALMAGPLSEPGPAIIGRAQGMAALICADGFERAERIARAELAAAQERGAVFEIGLNTLFLAVSALFRGAIADAEASARHVLDLVREHGFPAEIATATAVLTETLIERGRLERAWDELEALGMSGELPELNTFTWVLARRGRLRAALGDPRGALNDLLEASRRYASWGIDNPSEARWRGDAALARLALGDRHRAVELAGEELELARAFGAPRALGAALRVRGIVEGDLRLLEEAAEVLAPSPARLEHAHALVELGAALRRANHRARARAPLGEGLALARRCGATALAERAYDELVATGARPRKIVRTGVDALTASERRVATMAASGMHNKEIAQALFVTVRTVETHLHHVFQKLTISSRQDLARALEAD